MVCGGGVGWWCGVVVWCGGVWWCVVVVCGGGGVWWCVVAVWGVCRGRVGSGLATCARRFQPLSAAHDHPPTPPSLLPPGVVAAGRGPETRGERALRVMARNRRAKRVADIRRKVAAVIRGELHPDECDSESDSKCFHAVSLPVFSPPLFSRCCHMSASKLPPGGCLHAFLSLSLEVSPRVPISLPRPFLSLNSITTCVTSPT